MMDTAELTDTERAALIADAHAAHQNLQRALAVRLEATAARDRAVIAAVTRGVPIVEVARAIGVSGPIVSRIIARQLDQFAPEEENRDQS